MAKEFECPVVALVQLNRESEKGKKPKASDIKESGQIEQDADQIILVNPLTDDKTLQPLGVTELIIAKIDMAKEGVCAFKSFWMFVNLRQLRWQQNENVPNHYDRCLYFNFSGFGYGCISCKAAPVFRKSS